MTTGPERTEFRAQPTEPLCSKADDVELCVWPESAESLAVGLEALGRVTRTARPFLDPPDDFFESGLRPRSTAEAEYAVPPPREGRETVFAVLAVLPVPCAADASRQAHGELVGWLLAEVDASDGGQATEDTTSVLALSPQEKRTWVQERLRRVTSECPT